MIRCIESPPVVRIPGRGEKLIVSLFADTKAEVENSVADMDIVDFPAGYDIEQSSSVMTAAGEFAFRKSDGTWQWQ